MSSLVPDAFKHLETLSASEIEMEVQKLRTIDPKSLTDEQLERALALHAIARRKTSGPAKPKTGTKAKPMTLDELSADLGV